MHPESPSPLPAGERPSRRRTEYADFAVRITGDRERGFSSEVVWPPTGADKRAPFVPPFDEVEIPALLGDLQRSICGAGEPGARHLEAPADFERRRYDPGDVGLRLYEALFRGEVAVALARCWPDPGAGLRIRLVIDPRSADLAAVAALPWELLRAPDGDGFLGTRPLFAVVRYVEGHPPRPPQPLTGDLRVLAAFCSPSELPGLDSGAERAALERWSESPGVDVTILDGASFGQVEQRLRDELFHVFHFSGHGNFAGGHGTLAFERDGTLERVDAGLLTPAFDRAPSLRLAVINACDSGRAPRVPGADPYHGVATALVRSAVPAVIGMQFPISDRAAARFAEALYGSLAAGDAVDAAVTYGRLAIFRDRRSLEWATPALHLRVHDGQLFGRREPPSLPSPPPQVPPRSSSQAPPETPPEPAPEPPPARRRRGAAAVVALAVLGFAAWGAWRATRPRAPEVQPFAGGLTAATPADDAGQTVAPAAPDWRCPPHELLPGFEWIWVRDEPLELPPTEPGGTTSLLVVPQPFCIGRHEVTWAQMRSVLGDQLAEPPPAGDLPAFGVSWDLATAFLNRLGDRYPERVYRLPTGDEWELAARAGSTAAYSFGDDAEDLPDHGNCLGRGPKNDGYDSEPAPVGSYRPNALGLYDVHGNVWEWVSDPPGEDYDERYRVRRGGSFVSTPESCTASADSVVQGRIRHRESGFRIVLVPAAPEPASR